MSRTAILVTTLTTALSPTAVSLAQTKTWTGATSTSWRSVSRPRSAAVRRGCARRRSASAGPGRASRRSSRATPRYRPGPEPRRGSPSRGKTLPSMGRSIPSVVCAADRNVEKTGCYESNRAGMSLALLSGRSVQGRGDHREREVGDPTRLHAEATLRHPNNAECSLGFAFIPKGIQVVFGHREDSLI